MKATGFYIILMLCFAFLPAHAQYYGGSGDGYASAEASGILSSVKSVTSDLPAVYELSQNYPNPFNPKTTIRFALPKASHVILKVYTVAGKEVSTLINEKLQTGEHRVEFDAHGLPSGIYLYSITADHFKKTMRLAIIK